MIGGDAADLVSMRLLLDCSELKDGFEYRVYLDSVDNDNDTQEVWDEDTKDISASDVVQDDVGKAVGSSSRRCLTSRS